MKKLFSTLTVIFALSVTSCNNEPVQTATPQISSEGRSGNSDSISIKNKSVDNSRSDSANLSDQMVPENTAPKTTTANP